LIRLAMELAPSARWLTATIVAIIAAFVVYTGIAIVATLTVRDPARAKTCHEVFRDLLSLFKRGGK
jgi:hypothetical protein